ncbi:unnamed protein product, partial [Prorocentrum cordatum]
HSPVDASGQEVCQPPDVDDDATSFRESCEPRRGAVARLESWRRRRARRPLARQRRRAALRCAAAAPRKEGGGRRGRSWADTDHALAAAERIREVNLSTCFWPVQDIVVRAGARAQSWAPPGGSHRLTVVALTLASARTSIPRAIFSS